MEVDHYFNSKIIKDKKRKTFLERYGVDNPSKIQNVKDKKNNTCYLNYGVKNPSQSSIIQSRKSKYTRNKIYKSPSGKIYKVEGYEHIALDKLFKDGYNDYDILTHVNITNRIGKISFIYNDKLKIYHPDIYIISNNKIIEVKSIYWFNKCYDLNIIKRQICIDRGFNFEFWICDNPNNIEII